MLVIYLFYLLFIRKVKLYLIVGTYKILIYYEYEGKYKKVVGRERMHILKKIFCIWPIGPCLIFDELYQNP